MKLPYPQPLINMTRIMGLVLVVLTGILLTACQSTDKTTQQGNLVIGLTDAPGDLTTYSVELRSLTLTRQDGAIVEALPVRTRVDFAAYTNLTEFLTVATVPAGRYVRATLTLDYSTADIRFDDGSGTSVPVTSFVDSEGNPLGLLDVAVRLDDQDSLVVVPGGPAHMTLDFDLAASNEVDRDAQGQPILRVEPFLVADVHLDTPKIHRLRGVLESVDLAAATFTTILRPFRHRLDKHERRFGDLVVHSDETTTFEIDHETSTGQAGLEALAALPDFTAVAVVGDLDVTTRQFHAREVYAGGSVPGGGRDAVAGTVVARQGDRLTVNGAVLTRSDGRVTLADRVEVVLDSTTRVRKQFSTIPASIRDISIGQRIRVFGTIDTAASSPVVDASRGLVRMLTTALRARVVGTVSIPELTPPFIVDLQRIDGLAVSLFDFSGTGRTPADDADPHHYEIDASALPTQVFSDGEPVEIRGFVSPFGQAPLDFEAHTIIDLGAVTAHLAVNWAPASAAAFRRLAADGIVLDLAGVGRFHHVARHRVVTDLTTLAADTTIVPAGEGQGVYRIQAGDTVTLHRAFVDFVAELERRLAANERIQVIKGTGQYDDGRSTLSARRLMVRLR